MSNDDFVFHRRLPLKKITEDLPYRLAGITKEKKVYNDSSSESSDEIDISFMNKKKLAHDQKLIKKEYTFSKKRKKFDDKIQKPKTMLSNRNRIDIALHFNDHHKNFNQSYESNNRLKVNYDKYSIADENVPKADISYSNFDSSKSDGNKNLYPFLTEFDYISEEEKQRRKHLESIHISGKSLVPSSCKDFQDPTEFDLLSIITKDLSMSSDYKNNDTNENYKEIENWQSFLKNDTYNIEEGSTNSTLQSPIKSDEMSKGTSNQSIDLAKSIPVSSDSKESSKFKELLKHPKPKAITIDSNLQEKVSNRVTMKKNMTAAIHNSTVLSHTQPVLPISWPTARKSLVVKRHEKSLQDYLDSHKSSKMITNNEIEEIGKTLKKVERQREIAKEKQKIPDWAKGVTQPILMTAPKKTKVIVKSKYMKEYDYIV